uniref:Uncharacterized protein n=1 Tax=Ciona savignyi TaxID=51511 RepID=H2YBW9_CIOSA
KWPSIKVGTAESASQRIAVLKHRLYNVPISLSSLKYAVRRKHFQCIERSDCRGFTPAQSRDCSGGYGVTGVLIENPIKRWRHLIRHRCYTKHERDLCHTHRIIDV